MTRVGRWWVRHQMRHAGRQRARPHDNEDVAWVMMAWIATRTVGDWPYWAIAVLATGFAYLWTRMVWMPMAVLVLSGLLWAAVPSLRRWSAARVRTRRADRAFKRIAMHLPMLCDRYGHVPRVVSAVPFAYGMRLSVLLPYGVTPDDVEHKADELAHGWGAESGNPILWARVRSGDASAGACTIFMFTSDPLARCSPPLPQNAFEIGVLEDGAPLVWDPVASPHMAVVGDTGSGKSTALRALLVSLPSEWVVGLYDLKVVEFGNWPVAGRVVSVASEASEIVHALGQWVDAMTMRLGQMAAAGVRDVSKLPGYRPALVVIDEAGVLLGASASNRGVAVAARAALERLVLQGRAAGIHIALGYQRPDASLTGGVVRDSVAGRLALGWLSPDGASMTFGDPQVARMFRGEAGVGVVWRMGDGCREPVRCRIHDITVPAAQHALGYDVGAKPSPPAHPAIAASDR